MNHALFMDILAFARLAVFSAMLTFITDSLNAQSHEKGTVSFQLNFDAAVHATHYSSKLNGTEIESKDDAAATTLFMFNASYNPLKFLSVGLNTGIGSYIEDPDNAVADGNRYRRLGLDIKAYYLNHDRFNMFFGVQTGASGLEINRKILIIAPLYATQQYKYRAPYVGLNTGFNWYFANYVGINMQLGYSAHGFKLHEASLSGNKVDLTNRDIRLDTGGIHFQIGASVKF
jgi:hypothetical protein